MLKIAGYCTIESGKLLSDSIPKKINKIKTLTKTHLCHFRLLLCLDIAKLLKITILFLMVLSIYLLSSLQSYKDAVYINAIHFDLAIFKADSRFVEVLSVKA